MQKLSLLDYPGKVACTVFTGGCNFRCPFCHNASLVLPELLDGTEQREQVLSFLKKRTGLLDGVAITGGEPLMHKALPEFIRQIKDMGYSVKLDTNGSFPQRLEEIIAAGLVDRVAMDIKNSPALYAKTIGLEKFDLRPIEESIAILMEGRVDYEFRSTVVKGLHSEESLKDAARWISGAKEYYLQQYKDSGNVLDAQGLDSFTDEEMKALREAVAAVLPCTSLRGVA